MRFVAENPSTVRLLGGEPKTRKEGRWKKEREDERRKTKAAELRLLGPRSVSGGCFIDRMRITFSERYKCIPACTVFLCAAVLMCITSMGWIS